MKFYNKSIYYEIKIVDIFIFIIILIIIILLLLKILTKIFAILIILLLLYIITMGAEIKFLFVDEFNKMINVNIDKHNLILNDMVKILKTQKIRSIIILKKKF